MTDPTRIDAVITEMARDDLQLPTPASPPTTKTEEIIAEGFRAVLRVTPIGVDDHFSDLGGDSVMALQLMLILESAHGIHLAPGLLAEHETPRSIAYYLDNRDRDDVE